MKTRKQKEETVAEVTSALAKSTGAVFVNFHGLSVKGVTELRNALRAEGVGYKVIKKTLLRRALSDAGVTGEVPELDGEIAVAYAADQIAPARGVYQFSKTHDGLAKIMGGIFEGALKDQTDMMAMATIPPMQILRGMFVNIINSPIQRFVIAMDQIAKTKN